MKALKWIRDLLGFFKSTPYERNYLNETNILTGIYMGLVVVVLEVAMMIRNYVKHPESTFLQLFDNWNGFLILFSAAFLILVLAFTYLHGKKKEHGLIGIVLTLPIIALDIAMILRRITLLSGSEEPVTGPGLLNALKYYIVLMAMAVMVLVFCGNYYSGKKLSSGYGQWVMILFCLICLGFGIETTMSDLAYDRQILCFLTMVIYVACLLIWKPYFSVIMLVTVFLYFYSLWRGAVEDPEGRGFLGDSINLLTFLISISVVTISIYHQRLKAARREESLKEANSHLEHLAVCDELTGLHNMNYFRSAAADFIIGKETVSYLFFDVVNFKAYNEKYGFVKGNELLRDIGKRLSTLFPSGIVARASDDHFYVLTDIPEERQKRITEAFTKELEEGYGFTKLGIKVGAYHSSNKDEEPSIACDHARYACGIIKKHYGQAYIVYDEKIAKDFFQKQYVINSIDEAVNNGYIEVFYQPVVWSKDRKVCGLEALARWRDPKYGLLSPGTFIPALEEYHQVHKVDMSVLIQVLKDLRATIDSGMKPVPVSVNFSRLDFELLDIPKELDLAVKKYDIKKELLHIEITESALALDLDYMKKEINRLKDNGFTLWLDDFGSAYSSLNVLKDYDFDLMKIDMLFMRSFSRDGKVASILKSIIAMAKVIGMNTLTEGVETEDGADFLTEIGCDRLQGYYFYKPMPLNELTRLFEEGKLVVSEKL